MMVEELCVMFGMCRVVTDIDALLVGLRLRQASS
jgi:hypothetical protein